MENIDWGLIVGIVGLLFTVIGLFIGGKKLIMNIKPKTKSGNIDMKNSEYTMEKHVHHHGKSKK